MDFLPYTVASGAAKAFFVKMDSWIWEMQDKLINVIRGLHAHVVQQTAYMTATNGKLKTLYGPALVQLRESLRGCGNVSGPLFLKVPCNRFGFLPPFRIL